MDKSSLYVNKNTVLSSFFIACFIFSNLIVVGVSSQTEPPEPQYADPRDYNPNLIELVRIDFDHPQSWKRSTRCDWETSWIKGELEPENPCAGGSHIDVVWPQTVEFVEFTLPTDGWIIFEKRETTIHNKIWPTGFNVQYLDENTGNYSNIHVHGVSQVWADGKWYSSAYDPPSKEEWERVKPVEYYGDSRLAWGASRLESFDAQKNYRLFVWQDYISELWGWSWYMPAKSTIIIWFIEKPPIPAKDSEKTETTTTKETEKTKTEDIGIITEIKGDFVEIEHSNGESVEAKKGMAISIDDKIFTGLDSEATLELRGQYGIVKVHEMTQFHFREYRITTGGLTAKTDLTVGDLDVKVDPRLNNIDFTVRSRPQSAGIRNTHFLISYRNNQSNVYTFKGEVKVTDTNKQKTVYVNEGYWTSCDDGGLPTDPVPFNWDEIVNRYDIEIGGAPWESDGQSSTSTFSDLPSAIFGSTQNIILVLVIIGLIVGIAIIARPRRPEPIAYRPPPRRRPVRRPPEQAFCAECGGEIPKGSKFCPICGSEQ